MEPRVPDVELFIVLKWMVVVVVGAGLAQLTSLWIKRKWYGSEKHTRRDDAEDSRGWIERFLVNQREHTKAIVDQTHAMSDILKALEDNGKLIEAFTRSAECKFDSRR